MRPMRNRGFTLIELLVVIAIIGLLATVVLVSMSGLQSRARITKNLEFSQSVQRNLGAYAVGIWSFDDQTNPTKDGSGYDNNGTVNNASFTTETPQKAAGANETGKYALIFDGLDDYVDAGAGAILDIRGPITLEAWVNITQLPSGADRGIVGRGYSSYQLAAYYDGRINFYLDQSGSNYLQAAVSTGAWHHIIGTWDGTTNAGGMNLYIDGQLKASRASAVSSLPAPTNNVFIGKEPVGGNFFNGLIDEVRIYEKALTLGEIQKHYAEGLEKYRDIAIKYDRI